MIPIRPFPKVWPASEYLDTHRVTKNYSDGTILFRMRMGISFITTGSLLVLKEIQRNGDVFISCVKVIRIVEIQETAAVKCEPAQYFPWMEELL